MKALWMTAVLLFPVLQACSSDGESADDLADSGPDGGDEASSWAYPIERYTAAFEPCSLYEGAGDGLAECAVVQMPMLWNEPEDGGTIGIRVKRILSSSESEAQLWLLAGGPGQSGTWDLAGYMEKMQDLYPELDVYTLDHRGTGGSGRLSCPDAEAETSPSGTSINSAEMNACIEGLINEWGDGLNGITTTDSAVDVAALIEATREEGKPVFVEGGSYGTYWAQRYIQIFPDQADGVILAGIFPADGTAIWYDELTNEVAHEFFNLCGSDEYCSSKLGSDPWSRLGSLMDSMDEGHCVQNGITKDLVRALFAYLMYWNTTNIVVPAAVYRLERCEAEDVNAILNMYNYLFGDGGTWDLESYSILLQNHIQFSEMWEHPSFEGVDLAEYFVDIYDQGYVIKNGGPSKLALRDDWPIYDDAVWDDGWSDTTRPMLMLQGHFDPATVLVEAARVGDRYSGENQHFVEFPHAAHGTLGSTPIDGGQDCAHNLFVSFMKDPTGPLDVTCVSQVAETDFAGSQDLAQAVFGTADLWENDIVAKDSGSLNSSVGALELRERIRREMKSLGRNLQ